MNNLECSCAGVCHLVVEVGLQFATEVADVHHIHCELVILNLPSLFLRQLEGDVVSVHGGFPLARSAIQRWRYGIAELQSSLPWLYFHPHQRESVAADSGPSNRQDMELMPTTCAPYKEHR